MVWLPAGLAALLTFGLTLPLWNFLDTARSSYAANEIHQLPPVTDGVFRIAPYLWVPALARVAYGSELLLRDERNAAYRLFWAAVIVLSFLHGAILCALSCPFFMTQTH